MLLTLVLLLRLPFLTLLLRLTLVLLLLLPFLTLLVLLTLWRGLRANIVKVYGADVHHRDAAPQKLVFLRPSRCGGWSWSLRRTFQSCLS